MEKDDDFTSIEHGREKNTIGKGERLFGWVGPSGDFSAMERHSILGQNNQ